MSEWISNHEKPLSGMPFPGSYIGDVVEILYYDRFGVTRIAKGPNGYPFGVFAYGVEGAELPGAERGAWGELSNAVPYGRIKYWRVAKNE